MKLKKKKIETLNKKIIDEENNNIINSYKPIYSYN